MGDSFKLMAKEKKMISTFEIAFEITFECFVLKYQNRHKIRSDYTKMTPFKSNENLSELVKLYPCLYNKQEKDFKKEEIKQRAWKEIAKELDIASGKEAAQSQEVAFKETFKIKRIRCIWRFGCSGKQSQKRLFCFRLNS